jgi:hypothetical protein
MPSINLDLNYFDHPKTKRLVGLLGRGADVLPVRLWCTCGKHYPDSGELTGLTAQEIESQVAWWGQPGQMVEAMVKVGFLEKVDSGYAVHDWQDHSGHLAVYRDRAKTAAKARWSKKRPHASSNASSINNASSIENDASSNAYSNASSNAPSIAKHCPTTAMQKEEGKIHARDPTVPVQVQDANHTPQGLAWRYRAKKVGGILQQESDAALVIEFEALFSCGVSASQILAEIDRKGRKVTEPIWELVNRLKPKEEQNGDRKFRKPGLTSRVPIDFNAPPRGTVLEVPPDWKPSQRPETLFSPADETA